MWPFCTFMFHTLHFNSTSLPMFHNLTLTVLPTFWWIDQHFQTQDQNNLITGFPPCSAGATRGRKWYNTRYALLCSHSSITIIRCSSPTHLVISHIVWMLPKLIWMLLPIRSRSTLNTLSFTTIIYLDLFCEKWKVTHCPTSSSSTWLHFIT